MNYFYYYVYSFNSQKHGMITGNPFFIIIINLHIMQLMSYMYWSFLLLHKG